MLSLAANVSTIASKATHSLSSTTKPTEDRDIQLLVKFNNSQTYVLNSTVQELFNNGSYEILHQLSTKIGLPSHHIKLRNFESSIQSVIFENYNTPIFLSAYSCVPIRGGKGGFGTLLKGQSKQAGARKTIDFGACRDLNGRRLRHVNDEIKLRHWREGLQRRAQSGTGTLEEETNAMKTSSGIHNWHLAVPKWSDLGSSTKSIERQMKKEVSQWFQDRDEKERQKIDKKNKAERTIVEYAAAGKENSREEEDRLSRSIQVGMAKRIKISHPEPAPIETTPKAIPEDDRLSYLSSVSGDFVIEDQPSRESPSTSSPIMIQSSSEFATAVVPFDPCHLFSLLKENTEISLYYEVEIQTGGLAQIGWAMIPMDIEAGTFRPNSETGDGVGDDSHSYGFDGSRNMVFHNEKERNYGSESAWKHGDIIGCTLKLSNHEISYSINGQSLGIAFQIDADDNSDKSQHCLYPALSLNRDEIVGVNIGPKFRYQSKDQNVIGVSEIVCDVVDDNKSSKADTSQNKLGGILENDKANMINNDIVMPPVTTKKESKTISSTMPRKGIQTFVPIELDKINEVQELEALGMEKLKEELLYRGCKSGGSLQERAKRLLSIKGLTRDEYPKKVKGKNFHQMSIASKTNVF